jgi:flagellar hook-length control protein FliK
VGTVSASALPQASSAVTDRRGNSISTSHLEPTSFATVLGAQAEEQGSAGDRAAQAVAQAPLKIPGNDAARSRKLTKRLKQEDGPDPSVNCSVGNAPTIPVPLQTPLAEAAMMFSSNVAGSGVAVPDVSGPSQAANFEDKTSPASTLDPEAISELILGQANVREPSLSGPTALTPTGQMPAETDEDLQATTHAEEPADLRDTLSPEVKNIVESRASVPGTLDNALTATSAAGSLFAPAPHFMPQITSELTAQSASAAATTRQIPKVAAIAAAISPAGASSAPQPPDRRDVPPGPADQPSVGQPAAPIQLAGNGFASIAVTASVEGPSNPTIVPATVKSRTSNHEASTPVPKSARLAAPTASDDADSSQDPGSPPAPMMSVAQEPSPAAIAVMHPTSTCPPPPQAASTPIQPVASPETIASAQSTNGQANGPTTPPRNDNPSPQTDSPTPPGPTLQAGRILERMGQSEMHVGVKTADFGTIEVHTSLNQDRVGASLSTSHADLRSAMEAELPSLQQAISRHHLQLDAFDVASHAGGQGGDSSTDSRPQSFTNGRCGRILPSRESESAGSASASSRWMPLHSSRLSVIA